ncbi:hypothetical protein SERLA73DRAFT_191454 [Serpula lacrymans var. lacrymans S7.3]|uniref:Uncharacterized protein n=2 Tax=Serpula lacrymans var. lacrymans TaxID=341189 RepID=F8QHM4_SERL3|nr:uncharacterized protein SERLADRAFT_472462 [Serpula lacrymans var. lacrymans S7.9]EGN92201.1 hypothetical protein SERLA73DRAFT_191454 [Serpula lacrymans var. lacrymans S7.3]EGO22113.1 hypothetical protein SERLADRAFT_472462 [Serpula lacrymans var. lacrymans S7.9]
MDVNATLSERKSVLEREERGKVTVIVWHSTEFASPAQRTGRANHRGLLTFS